MKIYDVSVPVTPGLVTWPGNPPVSLERLSRIEDGANSNGSLLSLHVHSGTHVDAPFHFLPDGNGVESLPLDLLVGEARVIELESEVDEITAETLVYADLNGVERVLFKTRNSTLWENPEGSFDKGFVGIGPSGAELLVWRGIKLVGMDYLSVAPYKRSRETHEIFLKHGVVLVEGLDLRAVPQGDYQLTCLPLKLVGSDGAPARVILTTQH